MNKTLMTLALGATMASTQALAQNGGEISVGGFPIQNMTRAQAQEMADGMFKQLDLNHDGSVTKQEAEEARQQLGFGGEPAERMIERMFGSFQSLTQLQFQAQSLARFDAQDANHDGTVTAAERRQARAARTGQGDPAQ